MTPTHIEHIGIAVRSLTEAIPVFEKMLGTSCSPVDEVADQKVKTAFFRVGQTKIELLQSTAPDGPIGKFIEKRGEGIHHIALAVHGVARALAELQSQGFLPVDLQPRHGADGVSIGFLHPKSTHGVLIELCEKA